MSRNDSDSESLVLGLILAVGLLGMMAGSLISPGLPTLIEAFDVSEESVGLVLGVYALATALSLPFMGFLIDRLGRKSVLIPSLLLNGLAGSLCALAPNFSTLLALRAIQGIGIAGMAPVALTLIGDFYSGIERVKAMGIFSGTLAVGGVIFPMIGGSLASLSWESPFLVFSVSIPLAFITWIWLPSLEKGQEKSIKEYLEPLKNAVKNSRVFTILFSNFLIFFFLYTIVTFLPIILVREYGISTALVGVLLAIQGITVGLVSFQSNKLVEKVRKAGLICIGFLITGISLLILPMGLNLVLIGSFLGIFGIGRGLIQPQINALVTEAAPKNRLGGLVSIYNIMKYAGQMAAPITLGWVITFASIEFAFWVSGILGISAFVIAFLTICK